MSRNPVGGGRQREAGPERGNGQREEAAAAPGPGPPPLIPPCALRAPRVPGCPSPRRSSRGPGFREARQGAGTGGPRSTPGAGCGFRGTGALAPGWLQSPGGTVPGGSAAAGGTNGEERTGLPTPGALPARAERARSPGTPGLSPGVDTGGDGKGGYRPGTEVYRVGTGRYQGSTPVVPEGTGWEDTGWYRGASREVLESYRRVPGWYRRVLGWYRRGTDGYWGVLGPFRSPFALPWARPGSARAELIFPARGRCSRRRRSPAAAALSIAPARGSPRGPGGGGTPRHSPRTWAPSGRRPGVPAPLSTGDTSSDGRWA